jgi:hypothetical protein
MKRLLSALVAATLLCVASLSNVAAASYKDPWDTAADAAAERSVARLGTKRALEIRASVLTIPVLLQGSTGTVEGPLR